jgi:hypothetical protein
MRGIGVRVKEGKRREARGGRYNALSKFDRVLLSCEVGGKVMARLHDALLLVASRVP